MLCNHLNWTCELQVNVNFHEELRMGQADRISPQDQLKILHRHAIDGDLAGMMKDIGEFHLRWNSLSPDIQSDVKKMEGVFLTMLQAKASGVRA
jgi:hypothetical protein